MNYGVVFGYPFFYKGFRNRTYCFRRHFSVCYLCSHRSNIFLWAILLIVLVTHFTAVLHAGSQVSCHNFRSLCLCFKRGPRSGRSHFRSESMIFLVESQHTEAIGTIKPPASVSAHSGCKITV
jgi:hypothetical protein